MISDITTWLPALVKALILLGAALWTLADALDAAWSLPKFLRDGFNRRVKLCLG